MKTYLKYIKISDFDNIELNYLNLPDNVRSHVRSKKNELHFKQSVIAWSLLFLLGKNLYNIDNFEIMFSENGKPSVVGNSFYFSISHSSDYVAVTLSKCSVAVDIQEIKRKKDYDYLCKLEVSAKLQDKSIFKCREEDIKGINYYNFNNIKKYVLLVGSYEKLEIEVL